MGAAVKVEGRIRQFQKDVFFRKEMGSEGVRREAREMDKPVKE